MFKLIATLFVLVNGVPSDESAGSMVYNNKTFETEQSCKDFIGSDEGRIVLTPIARAAASRGMALGLSCVKEEDNTI